MNYYGVDWLAESFVLLGTILIANHYRSGWLVSAAGSTTFIVFGYMSQSVAVMIFSAVFLLINIWGWINGKRKVVPTM